MKYKVGDVLILKKDSNLYWEIKKIVITEVFDFHYTADILEYNNHGQIILGSLNWNEKELQRRNAVLEKIYNRYKKLRKVYEI